MSAPAPRPSHAPPSPRPTPAVEIAEFFARLPEARERVLRELAALDDVDSPKGARGTAE